jgi:hypothetical protein
MVADAESLALDVADADSLTDGVTLVDNDVDDVADTHAPSPRYLPSAHTQQRTRRH